MFLTAALGRGPQEDIVDYIEKKGLSELLEKGERGEDELIAEYLELEGQFGKRVEPIVVEVPGDARCKALSRILAIEAARREDVFGFRQEYLKGKLLEPDKVSAWVKAHGRKGVKAKAPKPRGTKQGQPFASPSPYQPHRLYCFDARTETVLSAGLWPGSPLVELKAVTNGLCSLHNAWDEPYVTNFILDGVPPPIPLARIELKKNPLWPAESRAFIIIDPITLPHLPIKILLEIRQEVLPKGSKRTKALSGKHLELAVVAEHKRGEAGRPWEDVVAEWNKEHPELAYRGESATMQFGRDARTAWTRVTGRGWA